MHGGASIDVHSALKPAVLACYILLPCLKVSANGLGARFESSSDRDHPVMVVSNLRGNIESLDR